MLEQTISLSSDGLGIEVDYRVLVKNLSELYQKSDALTLDELLNPELNEEFFNLLVNNWINGQKIDEIIGDIERGKLPGFEENIAFDWLQLSNRDYNYQWRLHSFSFLAGFCAVYNERKEVKHLNILFQLIHSWQENFVKNHHPKEIFAWNDHTTANRLLNFVYLFFFLKRNGYIAQLSPLKNLIIIHVVVLACRNFYSFHTNHGLFQAYSIYIAATALEIKFLGVDYAKIGLNRLIEEKNFSFTASYVHKENSPEYHWVIFNSFLQYADILERLTHRPTHLISDLETFKKGGLKFLAYAINPRGYLPIIGDTEEKTLINKQNLSRLSNGPYYEEVLYAISKGKEGKILSHTACAFAESGYFFIKSRYPNIKPQDQFYLAAKSGFLSKYHRQDDDCHFVLTAYNEDWLIDGGLYKHEHHDTVREYMRSHYSHNLLMPVVDDLVIERQTPPENINRTWGITNWMVTSNYVEATLSTEMYSGYYYQRSFLNRSPFTLELLDSIEARSNQNTCNEYHLVFHFPNDKTITILNSNQAIEVCSLTHIMRLSIELQVPVKNTSIEILHAAKLPKQYLQKTSKKLNVLESTKTIVFKFKSIQPFSKLSVKTLITITPHKKRVFVLGSCVTRDAFELAESKNRFELVGYLARTSFASTFHDKKIYGMDLSPITSSFQRRMVENDLLKTTTEIINNTAFDYIIVDFIDERFDLLQKDSGEVFTLSSELTNNVSYQTGYTVPSGSEEFFELWKRGWQGFINLAEKNKFIDKIIVNKVFWANVDENNEAIVEKQFQGWIDKNNKWLEKLYGHIEKEGKVRIIDYSNDSFIADRSHKWGVAPFHYCQQFYLKFLGKILSL